MTGLLKKEEEEKAFFGRRRSKRGKGKKCVCVLHPFTGNLSRLERRGEPTCPEQKREKNFCVGL